MLFLCKIKKIKPSENEIYSDSVSLSVFWNIVASNFHNRFVRLFILLNIFSNYIHSYIIVSSINLPLPEHNNTQPVFFRVQLSNAHSFIWRLGNDFNPLNTELNPICSLLALLAHHFLHVSRIRIKSLTIRLLMSYIYGSPILDVSRSHTTTHHSR